MPTISIVIPTLNEADNIGHIIDYLKQHADASLQEIIVVDAQSDDNTEGVAWRHGAVVVQSPKRGRAAQMNAGATRAKGDILYFVHADCYPPTTYISDIFYALQKGFPMGCYRYRFDSDAVLLKINAFFNRFEPLFCRGGDETLFIEKVVFYELNGFDEYYCIMEEYDFIRRAKERFRFKIIPKYAVVSARKYETNSWWRVQRANAKLFSMFQKGAEPEKMAATYKKMLNYR
ncbi:MAG: TIGR04283 family arsenosugar biosynthesis glycosyltransferase [Saprospiraceae bacterium]|nr:TIGR04283 family arsenosugar biosynthesis glycosyltransferase [Saprospiraceae bacterium]